MPTTSSTALPNVALDQVFRAARTFNKFSPEPVANETLRALYDLCKWGPTSANAQPMRVVFVKSESAKARLRDTLMPGNLDKTMAAPVTAIIASDTRFYDHLPTQFPHLPQAREMFADNAALAQETAFRNSSLQGAYLIVAARMLGLDVGPMSGFDAARLNASFFGDGRWQANFLVNLGYGDPSANFPRSPRLDFDQAARIE